MVEAQVQILDPLDGVINGVIDQPAAHYLDPEIFRCGGTVLNDSVCLSAGQVQAVRAAYNPIANSAGQIIYPAWEYGCDTSAWTLISANNTPGEVLSVLEVGNCAICISVM
jgi:feruloyl esterase